MIITDPIHREQLRKLGRLANFLDDLPHDKFHMPQWASKDATEDSCGTAGCAGGWAATIYKKEGWRFVGADHEIQFKGFSGYVAFAKFFGLNDNDAYAITIHLSGYVLEHNLKSVNDITPRHAADRIRKVIRKYDVTILNEIGGAVLVEKIRYYVVKIIMKLYLPKNLQDDQSGIKTPTVPNSISESNRCCND